MVKPVTLRRTLAEWSLRPWTWAWARRTALPLGSPALSMGPLLRPYLRPSLGRPCPLVSVVLGVGTLIVGPVPHPVSDRVAEGSSTGESFVCDFQETLPMKPQLPQGTCSLHPHPTLTPTPCAWKSKGSPSIIPKHKFLPDLSKKNAITLY